MSRAYYRSITLDNTGGSAKTNFPARVSLTSANFTFAHANSDGSDLEFRATDGTTVLPYWVEAYDSTAQIATLWVRVPSISSGGSATVRLYFGDAGVTTSGSSGSGTFPTLFEHFDNPEASLLGPPELATSEIGNYTRYPQIIAADNAVTWKHDTFCENSRIVYDPAAADQTKAYKLYITGQQSATTTQRIGLVYSADGKTGWTEYGSNPVLGSNDLDDTMFVRDGSTIHGYFESPGTPGSGGIQIARFTSTDDGFTWTSQGITFAKGTSGAWDDDRCGSPCVVKYGTNQWVLVYDGARAATYQKIGVATSTDGINWTRGSHNPLIDFGAAAVPDDLWQDDAGNWFAFIWAANTTYVYKNTVADPTTWVSTDWVQLSGFGARTHGTLALAENSGRKEGVYSYIDSGTAANNFARRLGFLGNANVTFDRWNVDVTSDNALPQTSQIEAFGSELFLLPTATPMSLTGRWSLALTSGFAVGFRMKKATLQTEAFTRLSVGAGATVSASSNPQWATPTNAYSILFGANGTATSQLVKVTSGTAANLGTAFTVSDFSNYHRFEMRYDASGNLVLSRDFTSLKTVTDTAHAALSKDVMITQGQTASAGAKSWWDFLYVRPYDGVDPSATVGSETASTVYTATAASTLPSLTQAAAGTFTAPTYTATAVSTLPSLTQAATGTFAPPTYTATAASVLPSLTQTAAGMFTAPVYTGIATSSLPTLTQQATGTFAPPTYTGVAVSTLAALTQSAVGTFGAGVPNVRGYSRSSTTVTSSSMAGVTTLGSSRTTLATVGSSTAGVE